MYQPEAKLLFVQRYCLPSNGWVVYVDIDASEEGRTGGQRATVEARKRQERMLESGKNAREKLKVLGAQVGGSRSDWLLENALPPIEGDRDIVAFHPALLRCVIAEVEGQSSGQPEQKLYKAIGQLIMATSNSQPAGWKLEFVLVVAGAEISQHLSRATSLLRLGIRGLSIAVRPDEDQWVLGTNEWPRSDFLGCAGRRSDPRGG
jgi:hypothetical protein